MKKACECQKQARKPTGFVVNLRKMKMRRVKKSRLDLNKVGGNRGEKHAANPKEDSDNGEYAAFVEG
jgi:hypothetical protein